MQGVTVRGLIAILIVMLCLPVVQGQSLNEAITECPGTVTGSSNPTQIHLQTANEPTAMTVMWATERRGDAFVEWTDSSGTDSIQGSSYCYEHDMAFHMSQMTNLPLGEEISYRVGDGITWSNEMTFTTIDPASDHFEWISIADHGMSSEGQDVTEGIIADTSAQMVTISGDISYSDGNQNVWDDWFDIQSPSMMKIPWMTAAGNHENEPVTGFTGYEHRFDMDYTVETEGFYYTRQVPGALLVFMSTEHSFTAGSSQFAWLDDVLDYANLPKNRETHPFVIVYGHKPMYSSNSYHGSEVELRDALEDLYVEHNVDLVIAGHDHFYERTWPVIDQVPINEGVDFTVIPRGIAPIHLVIGIGGRSAYETLDEPQPAWSAYRENSSYGWTRLVYDDNTRSLSLTHHRTDDTIGDSFTLVDGMTIEMNQDSGFLGLPGFNSLSAIIALVGVALRRGRFITGSFDDESCSGE